MITLYNVPVSNYGSKIRVILTHKGVEWTETPPPDGYGECGLQGHHAGRHSAGNQS